MKGLTAGGKHPDKPQTWFNYIPTSHTLLHRTGRYSYSSAGVTVQPGEYSDLMHTYNPNKNKMPSLMEYVENADGCRNVIETCYINVCMWNCMLWIKTKIQFRSWDFWLVNITVKSSCFYYDMKQGEWSWQLNGNGDLTFVQSHPGSFCRSV